MFTEKKRKRNIVGEFAEIFEKVVGVEILEGDTKRAVCDTCKYRIEKSWKSGKSFQEQLHVLKRKHPISPLSSSKGDKETETLISRKKPGHRLTFDTCTPPVPIKPNYTLPATTLERKTREASCQTSRTICQCRPSSHQGTCVKVCPV